MAKRRRFTPEFKAELVFEVLSGVSSQAEVCRRHNLNENQLSEWKRHLLENAPSLFASTDKRSSDDQKRIAHLEQLVGRMAVALDIQKKLLTELDSRYLRSDATFWKPCKRSIRCEIFVKSSVSTAAVSIINPERIRPKRCCALKFRSLRVRIRDTGIGVSPSSSCVRDTALGPDVSLD